MSTFDKIAILMIFKVFFFPNYFSVGPDGCLTTIWTTGIYIVIPSNKI